MVKNENAYENSDIDYLASLHNQYYDKLTRYVFVRIYDRAAAEDIASEAFLKALKSIKSFRGTREQMPAWLMKIAHNLTVDYIRKEKRRQKAEREIELSDPIGDVEAIVERYAEIDTFSQGKLPGRQVDFTAINMGKNDLWIAATGSVLNLVLITTDDDFDHLHNEYLTIKKIDIKQFLEK